MKTPNKKIQAASLKPQGSLNSQPSKPRWDEGQAVPYPEVWPQAWTLKESGDKEKPQRHPFDLEERTAQFGEAIVRLSKKVPRDPTNNPLVDQIVRCGKSVGANYLEATESVSKRDFRYSISRCMKEAKETKFFLRMLAASEAGLVEQARELYREANELHLIFASMYRK
jgi:four helix bundle protein